MELNSEVKSRILAVAESLYDELNKEQFPCVDAIQQAAHVSRQEATLVLDEWRQAHTLKKNSESLQIPVPDAIKQIYSTALAKLWQEAQAWAQEMHQSAQEAWENERSDADDLNKQLVEAYEEQMLAHEEKMDEMHVLLAKTQEELVQKAHEMESLRHDAEQQHRRFEEDIAQAMKKATLFENKVAKLSGQIEALQAQNTALLLKLEPKQSN